MSDSRATLNLSFSRYWYLAPVVFCGAIFIASVAYCRASYQTLSDWFINLHPCFYKADSWTRQFFTERVKNAGNVYAVFGCILCLWLCRFFVLRFCTSPQWQSMSVSYTRADRRAFLVLVFVGLGVWLRGFLTNIPTDDETFFAVNCVGLHPLQAVSYYMAPNNHVLLTLINILPARIGSNGIITGRIIAGLFYLSLIPLQYFFLRAKTNSQHIAVLFCIALMLQWTNWGYAAQARGYSLYLLCAWASFIFLDHYLAHRHPLALTLHAVFVFMGCYCIPSFLLWEFSMLLYCSITFLKQKKLDWMLMRAHFVTLAMLYITYLPVLCFSGSHALFGNRFVAALDRPLNAIVHDYFSVIRICFLFCFAGFSFSNYYGELLLALIPIVVLFFSRNKVLNRFLLFYLIIWLVFLVAELWIKHFPPQRVLIAHQQITLTALLLAVYHVLGRYTSKTILYIVTTCLGLSIIILSARFDYMHLQNGIYNEGEKQAYQKMRNVVAAWPASMRVAVSDESYYWEYLCGARGIHATKCPGTDVSAYVRRRDEPWPDVALRNASKVDTVAWFDVMIIRQ